MYISAPPIYLDSADGENITSSVSFINTLFYAPISMTVGPSGRVI
jgi:hypothetical protein